MLNITLPNIFQHNLINISSKESQLRKMLLASTEIAVVEAIYYYKYLKINGVESESACQSVLETYF